MKMKIGYVTKSGSTRLEVDVDNQKLAVEAISAFQDVFEDEKCGKCDGTDIRFTVRDVVDGKKTYRYYEKRCVCGARLSFGCHQEGNTLFPRRWEKDEKTGEITNIGKNGWVKYNKETKKDE